MDRGAFFSFEQGENRKNSASALLFCFANKRHPFNLMTDSDWAFVHLKNDFNCLPVLKAVRFLWLRHSSRIDIFVSSFAEYFIELHISKKEKNLSLYSIKLMRIKQSSYTTRAENTIQISHRFKLRKTTFLQRTKRIFPDIFLDVKTVEN